MEEIKMKIKIIADSCCDLSPKLKQLTGTQLVPIKLQIGDSHFIDNEDLDLANYIQRMKESPFSPKTACPSPLDFIEHFQGADLIFCVTVSKALSGTYQSAVIAKQMYLEEHPDTTIHIFDSKSASAGETLVVLKIHELIQQGLDFEAIVSKTERFIEEMETIFLLESLEHLAKSGRLNPLLAKIANFFSIKVIAKKSREGTITLDQKVRGYNKAFQRLIDTIGTYGRYFEEKTLIISHCNAFDRAQTLQREVEKRYPFKAIHIVHTGGASSSYADEGGIIIAF